LKTALVTGAARGIGLATADALRDFDVSVCSIMVKSESSDLQQVVAIPVRTTPRSYVIGGPDFRVHGLSEEDAIQAILRIGVPVSITISRPRG